MVSTFHLTSEVRCSISNNNERTYSMNTNTYFCRMGRKLNRIGVDCPDPQDMPHAFAAWLQKRRDAAAVKRGKFPRAGKGWVFVPAK